MDVIGGMAPALGEREFRSISETVRRLAGIQLPPGKEVLVRSRLTKRLAALGVPSFDAYLALVENDGSRAELWRMIDLLTTNKTSFFRENDHFEYLRHSLLPELAGRRKLRFWSAGCSSGEEPYTLGMVLRDSLPDLAQRDVRILATDISERVLEQARAAIYAPATVADLPADVRQRHFRRAADAAPGSLCVTDEVRRLVAFARLNLMGKWPIQGPFDAIFCRNVMIYFDRPTQAELVRRFAALLAPGGHLFVGHSESLTGIEHELRYVRPAVYVR